MEIPIRKQLNCYFTNIIIQNNQPRCAIPVGEKRLKWPAMNDVLGGVYKQVHRLFVSL